MTYHKKDMVHIRIFKYLEPLWTGRDGKISGRTLCAYFLVWKVVENFDFGVQKWDSQRSIGDLSAGLLALCGLAASLFGITMYQNIQSDRIQAEIEYPKKPPINVQQAETVNAENIENVNTGTVQPKKMGTGD